ncbi:MAG: 1-acyl-sn-glycerol-3-phosphate acyltransferase [Saprospiraceae bacterium]|nr:1-acyl-sn-glycerol-3-phosphate acyltransferase [Saprospiraceae bacterium]
MQPVKPYPQVFERIDQWPIYKLSQDRRHFIEEIDQFTLNRLLLEHPKLYNLIAETIYQERNRIKETPWKVDPPNEQVFWNRLRSKLVKSESAPKTQANDIHKDIIERIIHRYSTEIVGTFSPNTFRFARVFLYNFFNRLLNAAAERWWRFLSSRNQLHERLQVFGEVETIRTLMKKGIVIVVPTHFSNIDSILVGFAMDQIVGLPSFSYGAGLNLYNSGAAAFFMNRLGAYRVDRRKKNPIYLETLKAMSMLSIVRGTNTLFFPGGTRARNGMVETRLKMGLLGTAVEAQRVLCQQVKEENGGRSDNKELKDDKVQPQKIFIVPLVMSYHFVLEAPFLIRQHLQITGKEKYIGGRSEGNSIREWLKFIWQFFSKKSDIILSFGKPMDVMGNFVDAEGTSFDARNQPLSISDYFTTEGIVTEDLQREAEYTKLLANKIVDRFHRENIVLSSHVVAFTAFNMLRANNESFDLYALLRLLPDDFVFPIEEFTAAVEAVQHGLFELEEKGRLKLSDIIHQSATELVNDGLKNLGVYHARKPLLFNKKGDIESDDFNTLFYYHNRLENFGLTKRVQWTNFKMETRLGEVKVES